MTSKTSISWSDLTQRRRILRSRRRLKQLQFLWRMLIITSLLGGSIWATTRPVWVLRDESNQIIVEGNHLLSEQAIQSLLPLDSPQYLLQIEPEAIASALKSHPPIADVTVTRQLFPPSLIVQVQERVPVAIGLTKRSEGSSTLNAKASTGFLDQTGVWIPIQSYNSQVRSNLKSLNLKVIGPPEQYRSYWNQVYQAVSRSPVKVTEIDCQDSANLILKTELGIVHLGPYTPQLTEQLKVLDQMRQISTKMKSSQIAYIDLKNPQTPLVQMNQSQELVKPDTQ